MSLAPPLFTSAPIPDDPDDVYVPTCDVAKLTTLRHALDRLHRHASRDPGVLTVISDDLAEAVVLLIPAVEYVENGDEAAA